MKVKHKNFSEMFNKGKREIIYLKANGPQSIVELTTTHLSSLVDKMVTKIWSIAKALLHKLPEQLDKQSW